jgi:hypothetical protein
MIGNRNYMLGSRLVMMTLILVYLLLGAALGQRFKVLVLIPCMGLVLPFVAAAGVVRAEPFEQIIFAAIAAASSLQVGYLAGIGLRHLMITSRVAQLNAAHSPKASARRALPYDTTCDSGFDSY